jgi:hypothetical protein
MDEVRRLIAAVDWTAVSHAYGPATDTPRHLEALLDERTRVAAFDELLGSIWHQSTVYDATVQAVPILAEIARTHRDAALHPLLLLVVCAEADDRRAEARVPTRTAIGRELQSLVDVTIAEGEDGPMELWPLTAALTALLPHVPLSTASMKSVEAIWGGDAEAVFLTIRAIARGADHDEDIYLSPLGELSWQIASERAAERGIEVFASD